MFTAANIVMSAVLFSMLVGFAFLLIGIGREVRRSHEDR